MAPKAKTGRRSQHRASTSYSSTDIAVNTTPNARNDGLREARTLKRKERSEVRRAEGEKYKEAGNTHFRASEYHKAAEEYQAAIDRHGPRAVYLSNLAAAWLKLEEWDAAEDCARRALEQDPSFIKARYRRGLARKGSDQLVAASIDFITVLQQDPTSAEAKTAYKEIIQIMRTRGELDKLRGAADDKVQYARDVVPLAQQEDMELESLSDSSDCQHEGNGLPCRSYNHDGCASGAGCAFSHAPDFNSIRDELYVRMSLSTILTDYRAGGETCACSI
ncbi:hypothetical protein BC834DRAFT_237306 [Gloeopeniophorella convolvens]|nr:hypothetical protein BC834DRAFT_237306 [Gloeopeniophorella convolvens]